MSIRLGRGALNSKSGHDHRSTESHVETVLKPFAKRIQCMKTAVKSSVKRRPVSTTNSAPERMMSKKFNRWLPRSEELWKPSHSVKSRLDVDILEVGNHLSSSIATSVTSDLDKCEPVLSELRGQDSGLEDAVLELVVRQNAHREHDHPSERFLRESCSTPYDRIQMSRAILAEYNDTWWIPCVHATHLSTN
jgi:hypothetical protein